jgi:hypothetical protein
MNENGCVWGYPTTLAALDTNYIIFKIIENFPQKQIFKNFQKNKFGEGKAFESSLLKFQISKLNNYYTDMCWSCQVTMVLARPIG